MNDDLARLVAETAPALTETYRARVERYGPDAARTLLRFYDMIKEMLDSAGTSGGD